MIALPWAVGTDLAVAEPANAMARFFASTFANRTGHPLAVVTGEISTAAIRGAGVAKPPKRLFRG